MGVFTNTRYALFRMCLSFSYEYVDPPWGIRYEIGGQWPVDGLTYPPRVRVTYVTYPTP